MNTSNKYFGTPTFDKVRNKLIEVARNRRTVSYKEIAKVMELSPWGDYMSKETGRILREICDHEHEQGRPMLTAVAMGVSLDLPGEDFFTMAEKFGKFTGSRWDKEAFWDRELRSVYAAWASLI